MTAPYRFETRWQLEASPEWCWAQVADMLEAGSVSWWPGIAVTEPPRALVAGECVGMRVRSPLGYRLRLRLRITRAREPLLLVAESRGDLAGSGRIEIAQDGRGGAHVLVVWQVSLERRWMIALSPLLRPLFRWAHGLVMARGERAVRARLTVDRRSGRA